MFFFFFFWSFPSSSAPPQPDPEQSIQYNTIKTMGFFGGVVSGLLLSFTSLPQLLSYATALGSPRCKSVGCLHVAPTLQRCSVVLIIQTGIILHTVPSHPSHRPLYPS